LKFYLKAQQFLDNFVAELDQIGLSSEIEEIDHLCLRVTNLFEYESWKVRLSSLGSLLTESYINGRPIAVYKLLKPIEAGNYIVDVIELPAPKPGRSYLFGFEHIEAIGKFPLEHLLARRSDLPFLLDNINAPINKDIQLNLNAGLIKFHDQSLEDLIRHESCENEKKRASRLAIFDFDNTRGITLPEGIHTLLSCLHSEGVELIVWTARNEETTKACLQQLGIERYFTQVFAFDPLLGSKPVPSENLQVLALKRTVVVVGDSMTDLKAAENLGAKFFQAAWIHAYHIGVEQELICESPLQCLGRILSYFKQN